ncbi:MAG: AMP-binding protein [Clostridia bacterium]|nr:AMP-binding protein [Clostridia bacterium]
MSKKKIGTKIRKIYDLRHMVRTSIEIYREETAFLERKEGVYTPITYDQLGHDLDALGCALFERGIRGRVAVMGENGYFWALSYLVAVCGLGVVVPLDKELPAEEVKNIANIANLDAIICSDKLVNKTEGIDGVEVIPFSRIPELIEEGKKCISESKTTYLVAPIDREIMSVLLFTSGTTGVSKGVMLSHKNICTVLEAAAGFDDVGPGDVFLSVLPLHHVFECSCGFLAPLFVGGAIAYCTGLRHIIADMKDSRVTKIMCVPLLLETMYKKIWQTAKKQGKDKALRAAIKLNRASKKIGVDLSKKLFSDIHNMFGGRLGLFICGGAAADPEIIAGMRDLGFHAIQGYGLTECAPVAAINLETCFRDASAGLTPKYGELTVMDKSDDGTGEICYRGDNVMLGYYDAPDLTDEVIIDGWFHTGDLGYIDDDGFLYITGRKKNVIVTNGGKNVFPEELETYLSRSPYVKESVVVGYMNDAKRDYDIVAIIHPDNDALKEILGNRYTEQDVRRVLKEAVSEVNEIVQSYKHINYFVIREEEFVKNSSRKIKRNASISEEAKDKYLKLLNK